MVIRKSSVYWVDLSPAKGMAYFVPVNLFVMIFLFVSMRTNLQTT